MAGPNPGGGGSGGSSPGSPGTGSPGTGGGSGLGVKTNPLDQYAPSTRKTETRLAAVEKILADNAATAAADTTIREMKKRIADMLKQIEALSKQVSDLTFQVDNIASSPVPSPAAAPTEASDEVESIVVTENTPAFVAVTALGDRADSANVAHFGKVIGLTVESISGGFSGRIELSGFVMNDAWTWTAGAEVYLNGTGLSMTAPSTGFVQQIGIAKGPTVLYVDIQEPVLL